MEIGIFLKGNVPSSKNSKNFVRRGEKTFLVNSATVNRYLTNFEYQYFDNKNKKKFKDMLKGKKKPYQIKFTFTRDSKRKFDASNIVQIIQDLMVRHNWLRDDNYDEMIPVFNPGYKLDPTNPGVLIEVL